jgi:hypothetical protein
MRTLGVSVQQYLERFKDEYPFAPAGTTFMTTPPEDGVKGTVTSGNHFDLRLYWTTPLATVAPWKQEFSTWVCPTSRRWPGSTWRSEAGEVAYPSYHYLFGFMARPQVWMPGATPDQSLLRPVRASDVRFTSAKVVFFDQEMAHIVRRARMTDEEVRQSPTPMLFADGHCADHRRIDAAAPVKNPFTGSSLFLHDTPGGAAGREF